MENRQFLESQINEKTSAHGKRMNLHEHLLNKQLLVDINKSRK